MATVVGSVLITLDFQDRASAGYVRAANVATRTSRGLAAAAVTHNNQMSNAFSRTAAAVAVLHGPLGGVASRLSAVGTLARTASFGMAALALGAGGAGFALAGFLRMADRMRLMENQLRTVTTSTSNLRDIQSELLDVSQRSRASMDASVTIYARTARATEHLGLSQQKLLRITETVQKAFAVGGASAAEAQGAAIQLSQGIASDRFSGDEFRSVAENAPVLLREMAKSLDVNIGKLREMAHAGKLTADVVTKAILDASGEIDRYFNMTEATIGQRWAQLHNQVSMYVHELDTAYGITRAVADGVGMIATNFESIANFALTIGSALGVFAAGRIGASLLGRGGEQASGLRKMQQDFMTHGLFAGTRRQAKEDADAASAAMKRYQAEHLKVTREMSAVESASRQRLIDMRMAHEAKLLAARQQEGKAFTNVNALAAHRTALAGDLANAQARVVQLLKQEQQEARRAVSSAAGQLSGASRRFGKDDSKKNLRDRERAQKGLTTAQERYRMVTERVALAEKGLFDDSKIKKYGAEVRNLEKQIARNANELARARVQFVKSGQDYVAAQRQGAVYIAAANNERTKALQAVTRLKAEQNELNKAHQGAVTSLREAEKRTTLLGAAQLRVGNFFSRMGALFGGAPGFAIMGMVASLGLMAQRARAAEMRTKALNDEMRELGFLVDAAVDGMNDIDDGKIETLRLRLSEINQEIEKMERGQGFFERLFAYDASNLGNILKQFHSIRTNVLMGSGTDRQAAREIIDLIEQFQLGNLEAEKFNSTLDDIASRPGVGIDTLDQIRNLRQAIREYGAFFQGRAQRRSEAANFREGEALADDMKRAQDAIDAASKSLQDLFRHRYDSGLIDGEVLANLSHLQWQLDAGVISADDFHAKVQEILNAHPGNRSALGAMASEVQTLAENFKDATKEMQRFLRESKQGAFAGTGRMSDAAGQRQVDYYKAQGVLRAGLEDAARTEFEIEVDKKKKEILKELEGIKHSFDDISIETAAVARVMTERNAKARNEVMSGFVDEVTKWEASGDPWAKNPRSSATGLGQFIESTWLDLFKKHFPDRAGSMTDKAILALRTDAAESKRLIELYAEENFKILSAAGLAVDKAALHLAHFLGPGGATKVLKASPDTPISQLLGRDQIAANPEILGGGATAGSVVGYAQRRAGMDTFFTEAIDQAEKLKKALADLGLEAEASKLDKFTRKVVEWAAAHDVPVEDIREYIAAVTSGDMARIPEVFSEIEAGLRKATDAELWAKLADLQIERSVSMLSEVDQELVSIAQSAGITGPALMQIIAALRAGDASQLPEVLRQIREELKQMEVVEFVRDSFKGFFNDLVSNLKNGENIWESFANAAISALERITQKLLDMALDQAINGLLGGLGGIFGLGGGGITKHAAGIASGAIVGLFHSGGVAGMPKMTRRVDPSLFLNAPRYHGGGIAGLRPNEVPAILERGERIIPANSNGTNQNQQNVSINVNVSGARGNAEIQQMVEQGVRNGIAQYDHALPTRVNQVIMDPRAR